MGGGVLFPWETLYRLQVISISIIMQSRHYAAFSFVCVCKHMHLYMHVVAHVFMYVWRPTCLCQVISRSHSPLDLLRQGLSLNLEIFSSGCPGQSVCLRDAESAKVEGAISRATFYSLAPVTSAWLSIATFLNGIQCSCTGERTSLCHQELGSFRSVHFIVLLFCPSQTHTVMMAISDSHHLS